MRAGPPHDGCAKQRGLSPLFGPECPRERAHKMGPLLHAIPRSAPFRPHPLHKTPTSATQNRPSAHKRRRANWGFAVRRRPPVAPCRPRGRIHVALVGVLCTRPKWGLRGLSPETPPARSRAKRGARAGPVTKVTVTIVTAASKNDPKGAWPPLGHLTWQLQPPFGPCGERSETRTRRRRPKRPPCRAERARSASESRAPGGAPRSPASPTGPRESRVRLRPHLPGRASGTARRPRAPCDRRLREA